jgi:hypothetical protein
MTQHCKKERKKERERERERKREIEIEREEGERRCGCWSVFVMHYHKWEGEDRWTQNALQTDVPAMSIKPKFTFKYLPSIFSIVAA